MFFNIDSSVPCSYEELFEFLLIGKGRRTTELEAEHPSAVWRAIRADVLNPGKNGKGLTFGPPLTFSVPRKLFSSYVPKYVGASSAEDPLESVHTPLKNLPREDYFGAIPPTGMDRRGRSTRSEKRGFARVINTEQNRGSKARP